MKRYHLTLALILVASLLPLASATHTDASNITPASYVGASLGCQDIYKNTTFGTRYTIVIGLDDVASHMNLRWHDNGSANGNTWADVKKDGSIVWDSTIGVNTKAAINLTLEAHVNGSATGWYARLSFTPVQRPMAEFNPTFNTSAYEWDATDLFCFGNPLTSWNLPATPDQNMRGWKATYTNSSSKMAFLFDETDTPLVPEFIASPGNMNNTLIWSTGGPSADYYLLGNSTSSHGCTAISDYNALANISAPGFTYTHTGLVNGVKQYYCVRAVNLTTQLGSYTLEKNATPIGAAGPYSPTLTGRAWRGHAELSWSASPLPALAGYRVYQNGTNILNTTAIDRSASLEMGAQTCYIYIVSAVNGSFEALSNSVTLCYRAPAGPIFGDHGTIWGGCIDPWTNLTCEGKGRTELAQTVGTTYLGMGLLWAIMLILGTTGAGYTIGSEFNAGVRGGVGGAIVGVIASAVMDLIPLWVVALVGIIVVAIAVWRSRREY